MLHMYVNINLLDNQYRYIKITSFSIHILQKILPTCNCQSNTLVLEKIYDVGIKPFAANFLAYDLNSARNKYMKGLIFSTLT